MSLGLSVLIVALDSTWCVIREQPGSWNREDLPRDPGSQAGPSTFRPSLPQLQIDANVVTLFHNNVSAAARAVDARTHRIGALGLVAQLQNGTLNYRSQILSSRFRRDRCHSKRTAKAQIVMDGFFDSIVI